MMVSFAWIIKQIATRFDRFSDFTIRSFTGIFSCFSRSWVAINSVLPILLKFPGEPILMGIPDNMPMRLFSLSLQIGFNPLKFDYGNVAG